MAQIPVGPRESRARAANAAFRSWLGRARSTKTSCTSAIAAMERAF
jgi:hypothetical protein